jgi:hypothetical protein
MGGGSWGIGLIKERDVCVVGQVPDSSSSNREDCNQLSCGDLILYAENEKHQFAFSPLVCSLWSRELKEKEDWYRSIVDLFKNSHELHLIIQRVG